MSAQPRGRAAVRGLPVAGRALPAAFALLTLAALAGCTTPGPGSEATPTPSTSVPTAPSGPALDDGAASIDLVLPSQEPVVLNGVALVAAVRVDSGDAARLGVESEDGFSASEVLGVGDTVEVPGWGVVGIVAVDRLDVEPPGDDDDGPAMPNPTGTIHLRAQLPGPYTITGRSLSGTVVVEATDDGARVAVGQAGPVLLTDGQRDARIDGGAVRLAPADADHPDRPTRVELRIDD